ncbi:MAG TPA: C-type lectin domain-containing protein [Kofleriaceae bacterium]|nr:C-type lectin domain-containing protein [Kofleriaceae bacterium]
MVRLALAPLLLVGCVQVFGLDDPFPEGGDGSGSGVNEACTGAVVAGTCYERFAGPAIWTDARDACAKNGARLAKMESPDVRSAVGGLLGLDDEAYLGATDEAQFGTYLWLDLSPVTYAGWLPTQPDGDPDEHCIILHNAGAIGWEDDKCDDERAYICEHKL